MNKRHYDSEETRSVIADKAAKLFAQKDLPVLLSPIFPGNPGLAKGIFIIILRIKRSFSYI
jgi:hypothetical protein